MAVVGVQIFLRLVWVETQLELDQLLAYSGEHFLDLARVDYLLRERQSVTHWTVDKWGHTPQQGSGLMMVAAAHLSFAGELGCDEPHGEGVSTSYDLSSSRLRTIPFCHSRLRS